MKPQQTESDYICTCDCHDPIPGCMHCMPCCQTCDKCKQRIKRRFIDAHQEKCETK